MAESPINLEIESLAAGGYLATSSDRPGLVAQGRTIAECMEIAQDDARKLVESYLDSNNLSAQICACVRFWVTCGVEKCHIDRPFLMQSRISI